MQLVTRISSTQIGQFTVLAFALGVLMVWLYAANRPSFGPGLATAGIAGMSLWVVSLIRVFNQPDCQGS